MDHLHRATVFKLRMWRRKSCDSTSRSDESFSSEANSVEERQFNRNSDTDGADDSTLFGGSVSAARRFGDFEDTYDWVECDSTSSPGLTYFFNLRSLNTTWVRPVSRHVQLPRFHRGNRIYNDLTCDLEGPWIVVSDEDNDYEDQMSASTITKEGHNQMSHARSEILAKLYYGVGVDQSIAINENEYFDGGFYDFHENDFYEENFPKSESSCNVAIKLANDSEYDETKTLFSSQNLWENWEPQITVTDFLETEFSVLDCMPEITKKCNEQWSSEDDVSIAEKRIEAYSSSPSGTDEDVEFKDYSVPRLRNIKTRDLLSNVRKRRTRRSGKKQKDVKSKKLKLRKIICEMYGTKTINYDPIEPELPPNVSKSNLSDSSVTSSNWMEEDVKPALLNDLKFCDEGLKIVKLSSSSSSSTSSSSSSSSSSSTCSCSSCASTSSDTSKSSSSSSKTDSTFKKE